MVEKKIIIEFGMIEKFLTSLGDEDSYVRAAAAEALGHALAKGGDIGATVLNALVKSLGDGDYDVRAAAAEALGHALEKGQLEILTVAEVKDYYVVLQNERKSQDFLLNNDINPRRALVLKVHSVIEGRIDPDDVKYVGQIADATDARDSLIFVLDTLRGWSVDGSSDAQNFLEARVGQIVSRRPKSGKNVIDITGKDELYIEAMTGSFRQRSLLTILTGRKFPVKIREKVMRALAQSGYIDSGYANVDEKDVQKYLDLVSQVFIEFKLIAPKILIENLLDHETTMEELKAKKPMLESLIFKRDYRVIIKAIAEDDGLLFVYYMFHQSPFQYQGTDPISFERFKTLIHTAVEKLEHENTDIVEQNLVEGYVGAGLDRQRAGEIAQAVLQGRPPLPKDSPYLDKNGDFIPQRVDVLAVLGDSEASKEAQNSFRSSMSGIGALLKINDLLARIPVGIEKRFSAEPVKKEELNRQYNWILHGIRLGVDLTKIFSELLELNDRIFPPQGRKRDINVMIAQVVNTQIRHAPMSQNMLNAKKVVEKVASGEDGRIDLESLDINALVRNSETMVNILKSRQKAGKLTPLERKIIGDQEIKIEHVIKILLEELIQRLNVKDGSPAYAIFQDLEAHSIAAFNNYVSAISRHVDLKQVPQVVYVDFVSKFNLVEFFRFSDGAHCCLASDPKVSSQYGTGIYEQEMPRYMANATSFWWQVTTDSRSGKQVGWYENWFGIESGKVFVGTELTYMSPNHHDRDLQTAILAKVEEILFSTNVTKIAQASWGHHAANSLSSPPGYKDQTISMIKLQSLEDGDAVYEDASVETNTPATKTFKVKVNPGESKLSNSGGHNVTMEFVQPADVTDELVSRLIEIEEAVFPADKQAGREYMEHHLRHPKALIFILKDKNTEEIVGYRHSVPATGALFMPDTPQYRPYKTEDVLYQSDVALLPEYWGKADMGEKFREYFREAKRRGFKYLATHTEKENGVRPGASLSQKYQKLGFEVKWQEPDWGGTGQTYDFLVLDLARIDSAMTDTAPKAVNPGGIDFNLDLLDLEVRGSAGNIAPISGIEDPEHIHIDNGLLPVIINITPIEDWSIMFAA
ncbi:MAG: HEAT repeat domain-containing protein [Candidatus Omnitrophica bacterium]|nr:HEAT repeat domain-containing protein [Candidatus Omnitrophota bacterium]